MVKAKATAKQATIDEATAPIKEAEVPVTNTPAPVAEEQDIVVSEPVDVPAPTTIGFDGSDEEFLAEADSDDPLDSFPRVKIDQKGSEATLGSLHCEEMAEEWESIEVVLLKIGNSRIMWPEKFKQDNDPVCRSLDGVTPDDSLETAPMANSCKDCPYSKWGKGQTPPDCKEVKDLLIMGYESYIPMWLSLSSTALSPLNKELLRPLKLRKLSLTARRSREGKSQAHTSMFKFTISTVLRKNDSGDAYIPVFSDIEEVDDSEKDVMVQIAKQTFRAVANFPKREEDENGEAPEGGTGRDKF